jgi:hypothetical protein
MSYTNQPFTHSHSLVFSSVATRHYTAGFLQRVIELYPASTSWFDGGAGTCGTMEALLNAVGAVQADPSWTLSSKAPGFNP